MIALTDLEVYNSIFIMEEENNKFELFNSPDEKIGGISYRKVRDEIEEDLGTSDITATDIQGQIIAPLIIKKNSEQVTKRMNDDKYMYILSGYTSCIFQDFEIFFRTEVNLVEDDIKIVSDEYNSSFITYEISPGMYTFRHISEVLLSFLQPQFEGFLKATDFEFDNNTMKTVLVVRAGIIALKFDEKSFFRIILGFTLGWD